MRKYGIILLIVLLITTVAGCANKDADTSVLSEAESDLQYVKDKGKLIVGITDFRPLDYKGYGEWIGFDADMAKMFAESIGVEVQFLEIDWDNKLNYLESGEIDCVWNGMTLTDEVIKSMACTRAYLNNSQVIIVKADKADSSRTVEDCMHYLFAVEAGSAGEKELADKNYRYKTVKTQREALVQVVNGTADAAVADSVLACATIGEATSYPDLTFTASFSSEQYGVGFRKNSDMAAVLDEYFDKWYSDGTMQALADTYGVSDSIAER